jgi:hypothetical protein
VGRSPFRSALNRNSLRGGGCSQGALNSLDDLRVNATEKKKSKGTRVHQFGSSLFEILFNPPDKGFKSVPACVALASLA